jgi:uncharacterized protein (DUF2141 family)
VGRRFIARLRGYRTYTRAGAAIMPPPCATGCWCSSPTLLAAAAACACHAPAGAAPTSRPASQPSTQPLATLSVVIKDLRNTKGRLIFGVFASAEGFPTRESNSVFWEVRPAAAQPRDGPIVFTASLPPGTYAASVLHDENGSGDMDKVLGGVPKEGYGVTNNPQPRFRAARYDEATFELPPDGARKTISVQYF